MARTLPSPEAATAGITHLHGFLLFAAVVAVVGFLCGTRHQRREAAPPPQSPASKPPSRRRRLSMSLSSKLPDGLWRRDKEGKEEESLWMKAIILGDKNKMPDEEEDEEGTFVVDGKGKRQRSYRPRTPRSLPVSRANSFSEKDGEGGGDGGVSSF